MTSFPDVPDLPGVPAIPRDPTAIIETVVNLVADVLGLTGIGTAPVWGLFLDGDPAVTADSVVAFGFDKGFAVATYQIEEGSFESYNKVQRPFTGRLRLTTGGSVTDRRIFLQSIDEAVSSLNLYDLVTPEVTYNTVNPVKYSYDRAAARGNGLLTVEIVCEQIRETAESAFSSSQANSGSTSSAPNENGDFIGTASPSGTVQSSSIANMSSPTLPGSQPFVNGGTVQPQQIPPGGIDISAVVQP